MFDLDPALITERALMAGEVHEYRVFLTVGQFLALEVHQRGVDLIAGLIDPLGRELLKVDSPTHVQGSERVVSVAELDGVHRLEVRMLEGGVDSGAYAVEVKALRPAAESDRLRAAGARRFDRAYLEAKRPESQEAAIANYREALGLFEAAADRWGQAETLSALCRLHWEIRGDRKLALGFCEAALPLLRELRDTWQEPDIVHQLGQIYAAGGDADRAVEYLELALELWPRVGRFDGEALSAYELGHLHLAAGESRQALDAYQHCLDLWRRLGDSESEVLALYQRALLFLELGKPRQALDDLEHALATWERLGEVRYQTMALTSIAQALWLEQQLEPALARLHQARDLLLQAGNRHGEAINSAAIGVVYRRMGRYSEALEVYGRALEIFRELDQRGAQAIVLHNLGALHADLGSWRQALESYRQAWGQVDHVPERMAASILLGIARAEHGCGLHGDSLQHFEIGLQRVEELRSKAASHDLRASYFATQQDSYRQYVDLLMDLEGQQPEAGWSARALEVHERALARSLLDLLTQGSADLRAAVDPELVREEQALERRIAAIERQVLRFSSGLEAARADSQRIRRIESERRERVRALNHLRSQIHRESPGYAELAEPRPLSIARIQEQVLDPETLLLEFALGDRQSYVWAVASDSITSATLSVPGEELESAARTVHRLLTQSQKRRSRVRARLALEELGRQLLGPIAGRLVGQRLLIVADGALQYIPFSALPNPGAAGRPLVADHEVVSMPSASALAVLRDRIQGRQSPPGLLAVVADPVFQDHDPRLKGAVPSPLGTAAARGREELDASRYERLIYSGQEALQILERLRSKPTLSLLDFAATKEAVIDGALGDYRIVHLATHGDLDAEHPELSRLVFSLKGPQGEDRDGFLFGHEIYRLDLPADLVVLSACQTALGAEIRGEGLVGLTQSFMHAGAARVLVSLWSVDDLATAELMDRFYEHLLVAGQTPAAALRAAQLDLRQTKPEPYYWAGFTLQGEWRR